MEDERAMQQAGGHIVRRKDVEAARAREFDGGHIAGMRAAANKVASPRDHAQTRAMCRPRGGESGWKLADGSARRHGLIHVGFVGVVVARERDAVAIRQGKHTRELGGTVARLLGATLLQDARELLVAPDQAATAVVAAVLVHVTVLALARGMVHERKQAQIASGHQGAQQVEQARPAQLTAQVQVVIAAQQVVLASFVERQEGALERIQTGAILFQVAQRQGVQHRGDTRGQQLRVMGEQGRQGRPDDAGTGHEVFLEVVGMQLQHAGQQVITREIDGSDGYLVPGQQATDTIAHDLDPTLHHAVGQHHAGPRDMPGAERCHVDESLSFHTRFMHSYRSPDCATKMQP
ncbi:hypothetical protein KCV01_g19495, partial [Aureobasidium melanogenum]